MADVPNNPELADSIHSSASRLGIDPVDLATAISYETGGKFSTDIKGGSGGKYLGLIQFSPDNQKKYGVAPGMTAPEQMTAVESYLRDRGVKPGMGLTDIYSTINAGRPGLYNASDANNGGAPGTVSDKVATMAPHRLRAQLLLGGGLPGGYTAPSHATAAPVTSPAQSASASPPMGFVPSDASSAAPDNMAALISAAQQIGDEAQQSQPLQSALPPMRLGEFPLLAALQARHARGA